MKTNITVIGITEFEETYEYAFSNNKYLPIMQRRILFIDDPMGDKIYYPRIEPMFATASSIFSGTNINTPQVTSHELKVIMIYEN